MWLAIGINMCWILARSCEEGALPASFIAWSSFFLADSLKSPEALSLESVPVWVVYQAHVTHALTGARRRSAATTLGS